MVDVVLADADDLPCEAPGQKLHFGELALSAHPPAAAQHRIEPGDLLDLVAGDHAFEDLAVLPQVPRDLSHVFHPSTSCMS